MNKTSQLMAAFAVALSLISAAPAAQAQQIAPSFEIVEPEGFSPPKALTTMVLRESLKFWGQLDSGATEGAYEMFSPDLQAALSYSDFLAIHAGTKTLPASRMIIRVSWYKDPPSAPRPGLMAAVDWVIQLGPEPAAAGYLLWQEVAPGAFLLLRMESNDFRTAAPITP